MNEGDRVAIIRYALRLVRDYKPGRVDLLVEFGAACYQLGREATHADGCEDALAKLEAKVRAMELREKEDEPGVKSSR